MSYSRTIFCSNIHIWTYFRKMGLQIDQTSVFRIQCEYNFGGELEWLNQDIIFHKLISLRHHKKWLRCVPQVWCHTCTCRGKGWIYMYLSTSKKKNIYLCVLVHIYLIKLLIAYEYSHFFVCLLVIYSSLVIVSWQLFPLCFRAVHF